MNCNDGTQIAPGHLEWELLIPEASSRIVKGRLAARLDTLEGKRIGLFWNTKPNGDVYLRRIGELIKERFNNVKIIEFMPGKADSARAANTDALKEASSQCDLVLFSTGD